MSESPPRRRRPAADPHIRPECRGMIRRGALVAVNSSGGKDSQAMTIQSEPLRTEGSAGP